MDEPASPFIREMMLALETHARTHHYKVHPEWLPLLEKFEQKARQMGVDPTEWAVWGLSKMLGRDVPPPKRRRPG
jgi:hypothetical protein